MPTLPSEHYERNAVPPASMKASKPESGFGRGVGKGERTGLPTLKILGRQDDGTEVVILDEALDLWRHLGSIPTHNQGLSESPGERVPVSLTEWGESEATACSRRYGVNCAYQSRFCHSGSRSPFSVLELRLALVLVVAMMGGWSGTADGQRLARIIAV